MATRSFPEVEDEILTAVQGCYEGGTAQEESAPIETRGFTLITGASSDWGAAHTLLPQDRGLCEQFAGVVRVQGRLALEQCPHVVSALAAAPREVARASLALQRNDAKADCDCAAGHFAPRGPKPGEWWRQHADSSHSGVDVIDTPGLVDGDVRYPFDPAAALLRIALCVDMIIVTMDPVGQSLCSRTLDVVRALDRAGHGEKLVFTLTRADTIPTAVAGPLCLAGQLVAAAVGLLGLGWAPEVVAFGIVACVVALLGLAIQLLGWKRRSTSVLPTGGVEALEAKAALASGMLASGRAMARRLVRAASNGGEAAFSRAASAASASQGKALAAASVTGGATS
ncbi:hypothetical protein FNF29_05462 [Cafeteria roenbergensis]|uniref:G domain-containing protein n=1 Tax=Cafeteria roenbergensis TaxID=33653 RepID=A0A5A8CAT4_CAFRO|nr:hypothetical protein FNF29_05462 [Cafeteria roenbergensis]|eukprot:KAA0150222.1 hypothetical protein FNF29_05462 [Cafeteria roenbergensis]